MTKIAQIWFRLEPKEKALIEKAAKLDRRSTSDFIRLAAIDRALDIIKQAKRPKRASDL